MPVFPDSPIHAEGLLEVGDGNAIAWEARGNPEGRPAVLLHGGPGSGRSAWSPRFFDPEVWRIVSFDQRGCGRSTPHASEPATDMAVNITGHLVADMERLREHLGVGRWLVFGHSWGCTLGLVYAQAHPERVTGLLLAGVTTTRRRDIDWLYRGMAPLFPEEFERFRAGAPDGTPDAGLLAAYARLLEDADPVVRDKAARDFHDWEAASALVRPGATYPEAWKDPKVRLARARICTWYFSQGAFLADDQVLRDAGALAEIPGVLVHGRLDLEAPLVMAWELHRAWPGAELQVIPLAAHDTGDDAMSEALVAATRRFARQA